jgi:hypothetical protein
MLLPSRSMRLTSIPIGIRARSYQKLDQSAIEAPMTRVVKMSALARLGIRLRWTMA